MTKKDESENDEMKPEYDFRGGVRGKHAKAYRKGYTIKIHKADGTEIVEHMKPAEGTAMREVIDRIRRNPPTETLSEEQIESIVHKTRRKESA